MKNIESIAALNIILKSFEGVKYSTNAYFFEEELIRLIKSNLLFFESFSDNLLLYKYVEELDFFEVYYYLKNISTSIKINDKQYFVMEIPYRGTKNFPSSMVDFWIDSGFQKHINRDLLGLNKPDINSFILPDSDFEYKLVDNLNLAGDIQQSIKIAFDSFTGDILTIEEVTSSIKKNQIIGAYLDGNLAGFIRFYSKNKVSWIGHLVVLPEYKGKGIGKSLVASYLKSQIENGFTNFQQWVVSDNEAALKLYTNFGFKYTNKNSISLLKK